MMLIRADSRTSRGRHVAAGCVNQPSVTDPTMQASGFTPSVASLVSAPVPKTTVFDLKQYAERLTALPAKGDSARTREGIANPPTRTYLTCRSFAYAFGSDARDARAWIKGESGDLIAEGRLRIGCHKRPIRNRKSAMQKLRDCTRNCRLLGVSMDEIPKGAAKKHAVTVPMPRNGKAACGVVFPMSVFLAKLEKR